MSRAVPGGLYGHGRKPECDHHRRRARRDRQTRVTLTYDWSAVPAQWRQHIEFPPFPTSHLNNSLANLAKLAEVTP